MIGREGRPLNRPRSDRPIVERVLNRFKAELPRATRVRLHQIKEVAQLLFYRRDVGKNTYIARAVHVLGWRSISIGHSSAISEGTWLNVNQRTKNHKHIVIGNNCFIGRRNFLSSGWQIFISDYCLTGPECKFLGSGHVFNDPLKPYVVSGTTNDKVIRVGVNVWMASGVTVIGGVDIGHGCIIGANTLIHKDIPPFSIVVGNPGRVTKRYDFVANRWVASHEYDGEHDYAMPDEANYLEILKGAFPEISMPLQAS